MKYWKYIKYIAVHKYYVARECFKYGLYWRGIIHDISKLLPSEFIPYANYFYGSYKSYRDMGVMEKQFWLETYREKEYTERQFNIAWLKHQKRNKHHWQYWNLLEDSGQNVLMPMPDKYRKEMLADWRGAGIAITGTDNTNDWYEKNKSNMKIHSNTMMWVEEELNK